MSHHTQDEYVSWCVANAATLTAKDFMTAFNIRTREVGLRNYNNILCSEEMAHLENIKNLWAEFREWKGSLEEQAYWSAARLEHERETVTQSLSVNALQGIKRRGELEIELIHNKRPSTTARVSGEEPTVVDQVAGESTQENIVYHPSSPTLSLASYTWDINDDADFWNCWLKLLQSNIPHGLSLEHAHIIQCGFSIKCDPRIPGDFYKFLDLKGVSSRICSQSVPYLRLYLDAARSEDLNAMVEAGARVSLLDNVSSRPFFRKILTHYPQYVYGNLTGLQVSEIAFNHRAIWPLFEAISDSLPGTEFIPGETRLQAIKTNVDESQPGYNADGLLKINDGFELLLLETSGPYNNEDKPRHGFDHVKAAFGLRMMLRAIFHKYYFGGELARELALYFAHVRGKKLHIWSLSMPTDNILVMDRIACLQIPVEIADRNVLLTLLNSLWALKVLLSRTMQVIADMRELHTSTLEKYEMGDQLEECTDLRSLLCNENPKPTKQTGAGDLLPLSSPGLDPLELGSPYLIVENIAD